MPVADIRNTRTTRTADRKLDIEDAKAVVAAAGKSVSADELQEIAASLVARGQFEVSAEARQWLRGQVQDLEALRRQARMQNTEVERRARTLEGEEKAILTPGRATETYGGSPVPDKVKQVLNAMIAAGASRFDVAELESNPTRDEHDASQWTLTGKWSPYPQEIAPTNNMSFDYTELTPAKIKADMETERDQIVLTGFKSHSDVNRATGQTMSWQEPQYETRRMKGSGNITSLYDEADHQQTEALGPASSGYPKFASNFAILADGTFHAVPAMRRTPDQPGLIITNPSLARGKRLLFNGHIEMRNGVVTSIGLSGRLQKLAAEGEAKFINPIPLLEAWGFQMAPNLRVHFEGSGDVKVGADNLIARA